MTDAEKRVVEAAKEYVSANNPENSDWDTRSAQDKAYRAYQELRAAVRNLVAVEEKQDCENKDSQ